MSDQIEDSVLPPKADRASQLHAFEQITLGAIEMAEACLTTEPIEKSQTATEHLLEAQANALVALVRVTQMVELHLRVLGDAFYDAERIHATRAGIEKLRSVDD